MSRSATHSVGHGAICTSATAWVDSEYELQVGLGPVVFARRKFRCAVVHPNFSASADAQDYWPIWDELPAGTEIVVVTSLPSEGIPRISRNRNTIRFSDPVVDHCVVNLAGTFDQYISRFKSRSREGVRRSLRRFAKEAPDASVDEFRTKEDMDRFLDIALSVSERSWQGQSGVGLQGDTDFRARALERAADDLVRGYVLTTATKPLAFLYCPIEGDAIIYESLGYDPEFARLSPGKVLFLFVLQRLFAEQRFATFDLGNLVGEPYKKHWATNVVRRTTLYYLPRTAGNMFLVRTHLYTDALVHLIRKLLDMVGARSLLSRVSQRIGVSPSISFRPTSADGRPGPRRPEL
jgi:CelD/BcsL family acetyltransferase involved in cellulose biosynthesis